MTREQIYEALLSLPAPERLRLIERLIHGLAEAVVARREPATSATSASLIGLWADESDEAGAMVEAIMSEREHRSLPVQGG